MALSSCSFFLYSCGSDTSKGAIPEVGNDSAQTYVQQRLSGFASVKLTADLSALTEKEKQMLPLLIQASKIMDDLYWKQSYPGNKDSLLNSITDPATKQFVILNYGPWDKLNSDSPFVAGVGTKPLGAGFYPVDITKEELEKSDVKDKHGH